MVVPSQPEPLPSAPHAGERDHPLQIIVTGKKRSGKSEYSYLLWDSWDGDRVCIDPTRDFLGNHPEPETIELESPPPARWPEHLRADHQRMSLRFVPNLDDPDYREQCDRVVGMAYDHGDCLLLIEEVGIVAPVGLPQPKMRNALHTGGHVGLYLVLNGPRVIGIDPLCISQSDEVICFTMQSPKDRRRVAENINFDPKVFEEYAKALGPREHIRYIAGLNPPELWVCGPLQLEGPRTAAEIYVDQQEEEK